MAEDKKKDLDHDQQESTTLAKSVKPDDGFMKSEGLCRRCHGKLKVCARNDCPQKG